MIFFFKFFLTKQCTRKNEYYKRVIKIVIRISRVPNADE